MTTLSARSQDRQSKRVVEKRLQAERQARFQMLQRKQKLRELVEHRLSVIGSIHHAHENSCSLWLSSVLISAFDITRFSLAEVPTSRCESLYYLSVSLDSLLEQRFNDGSNSHAKIQSLSQLFEEWEYFGGGNAMQSMRLVMAKNSLSIHPNSHGYGTYNHDAKSHAHNSDNSGAYSVERSGSTEGGAGSSSTPDKMAIRPSIFKFNGNVVYEYLLTPSVPFELCYSDILIALSESLRSMYCFFATDEQCWSRLPFYDAILRIDKRVKEFYITACLKEMTAIATRASEEVFELVRSGPLG
jgi:hypothetical protein